MLLGWRIWYEDGRIIKQTTFEEWVNADDDGLYGKMLYYDDEVKVPREIQLADWYYVAPHQYSNEFIHGTCNDNKIKETKKRYPGAVLKRGKWGPTIYFTKLRNKVWAMTWDED